MGEQSQGNEEREAAAAYVAELSGQLATLARRHDMGVLGYLLEMARLEAESVSGRPRRRV